MIKRKLILLAVSIVTLVVSIVSFTFAWLSINTMAVVTNIKVEAYQGEGLNASIDGVHFSSNISQADMMKAIVVKYQGLHFNELGEIVDENNNRIDLSEKDIEEAFGNIKLNPVTSLDGKEFYQSKYLSVKSNVRLGTYFQFDLYFKSLDDGLTRVFLNTSNYNFDENSKRIKKTQITSPVVKSTDQVDSTNYLITDFQTRDELGNLKNVSKGTVDFEVYAKDAMRFSIQDGEKSKIYELSEGLGSYSTSLDSSKYKEMYLEASSIDSSKSASFTYVKNQKKGEYTPLDIELMPETFKEINSIESGVVTTMISQNQIKKVLFTFWLEGFDADCFDEIISSTINVSLSFTTKSSAYFNELVKINYHNGEEVKTYNYFDIGKINPILPINTSNKEFIGWYLEGDLSKFDFDDIPYAEGLELDLYAKWQ